MRLYLAGGENKSWISALNKAGVDDTLMSYYYLVNDNGNKVGDFIKYCKELGKNIFIDSGGFSAWSKDAHIDIDEYITFIKQYQFQTYAQLDVIGNELETAKNLDYMLNKGLSPIPVFHYGGSKQRLRDLVEEFEYIALGGLVPLARRKHEMWKWLDFCFMEIRDKVRIHGFGTSSVKTLSRYPFYSVDSTSWVGGSKRGEVYTFNEGVATWSSTRELTGIEVFGFVDKQKKLWFERCVKNAMTEVEICEYITNLWTEKGVTWDD